MAYLGADDIAAAGIGTGRNQHAVAIISEQQRRIDLLHQIDRDAGVQNRFLCDGGIAACTAITGKLTIIAGAAIAASRRGNPAVAELCDHRVVAAGNVDIARRQNDGNIIAAVKFVTCCHQGDRTLDLALQDMALAAISAIGDFGLARSVRPLARPLVGLASPAAIAGSSRSHAVVAENGNQRVGTGIDGAGIGSEADPPGIRRWNVVQRIGRVDPDMADQMVIFDVNSIMVRIDIPVRTLAHQGVAAAAAIAVYRIAGRIPAIGRAMKICFLVKSLAARAVPGVAGIRVGPLEGRMADIGPQKIVGLGRNPIGNVRQHDEAVCLAHVIVAGGNGNVPD